MTLTVDRTEFANRTVAVVGMARTGLAAAPVLRDLGANVILTDAAPREALGERAQLAESLGVELRYNAGTMEALRGAELVVPSPGVSADSEVLRSAVRLGIPVLSEIEVAYRIARAPILAVTGTNGKTTTTFMLGEMLRASGRSTWIAGNVAADDVKQALITAAWRAQEDDVIVAEISSFQLEWVEKFRPEVGVLTNITQDHLDRHKTFEEYAACKARLFSAQDSDDVAVINAVNAPARRIGERCRARRIWFDRGHCMKTDSACLKEGFVTVRWEGEERRLCRVEQVRLAEPFNLENALAASAAATAFGAEPEAIALTLRTFDGVVHRAELVAEAEGVRWINNSMCTNVDAAVRNLQAIEGPIIMIAGGDSKGADLTALGSAIARFVTHLILIGRDAPLIADAARQAGFTRIHQADSLESAVALAADLAQPGYTVTLTPACSSRDMFRDFEERGEVFRAAVRARIRP